MILDDIIITQRETYTVVDKPALMSTIPDKTGSGDSLQKRLEIHHRHTLFPITRLDKVVSGLCLFAHSSASAANLSEALQSRSIKKTYIALVEGKLEKASDTLVHYLHKQGAKTQVYDAEKDGCKKAELSYETIAALDNYTIVKVTLETGRFHQIRGQFAMIGHPIKGDVKYGARRKNKDRAIHLHSYSLELPNEGEIYIAPVPTTDTLWSLAAEALTKISNEEE